MSKPSLADYFRGGVLRVRQAASDECHAMPIYRSVVFSGSAPLLQKPWPERPFTPNPALGEEIAGGLFTLAGKRLFFSNISDAWTKPTPSRAFASALHRFCWLQDLAAFEAHEGIAEIARTHVDTWIGQYGRWNRFAWNPAITAERCLAWLGASHFLFSGDAVATSTRLDSLGKQLRHLKSVASVCQTGETRLWVAIALSSAGTCLFGMKGLQKTGLTLLEKELSQQILPDGGHISRNPETAARVLLELEALRTLLKQHEAIEPPFLAKTIQKLQPFVGFCTLMNGDLALFNGGGVGDKAAIRRALPAKVKNETPFLLAPHSRYQRLQTRRSVLLFDCGGAPDRLYSQDAHAGALSFVFGTRAENLIVNCGWSNCLGAQWRTPSRTSAAHSTLVIDDVSSSRIPVKGLTTSLLGPILFDREEPMTARRNEDDGGVWLTASHREYVGRYGLQHNRRLYLNREGTDLRGEDCLEHPIGMEKSRDLQPIPFTVRFHLHPEVRASISRSASDVLLLPPGGKGWRFRTDAGPLSLEPSVYLGDGAPPRRSLQIVITGAADPNGIGQEPSNRVRWSLRQITPGN